MAATRPIQHAKARIGHHWRDHPGGNDYITLVELGEATALKEITLRYLAEAGRFHLRGLSLIDERTGTSESVVVSTAGHFRLVHSGDVKIYQNLDVLPRAFVVHRARVVEDDEAAVAAMRDESFRPNEEAILAEAPPGWEAWGTLTSSVEPVSPQATLNFDQVTMISYEPERVIIEADLASEGYLILTDTWYPGWRAYVDGTESSIIRANLLFRAIELLAGQHRVEFSYEPGSLRIGAAISSAALLAIVVGLWWWLVQRR